MRGTTPAAVPVKPLGRKAYGHIGHLPESRMGAGDHHCHEGQAKIATEKTRDRNDVVIVTEKLDGSCVAVAKINGIIVPIIRAGYPAVSSNWEQHRLFHNWAMENADRFAVALADGQRLVGEWLAQAHSTRYELFHDPFVAFDLMAGEYRLPFDAMVSAAARGRIVTPRILSQGGVFSVEKAIESIATSGHGAIDPVEGAVWRVERNGEFDFIAKYVRPDKQDGVYLPDISGKEAVWNWRPDRHA